MNNYLTEGMLGHISGYSIIEHPGLTVKIKKTIKERFFSLPWKPWVKFRFEHREILKDGEILRHGKSLTMNSTTKYKKENREKVRAHMKLANAIRRGDIIKKPCVMCGEVKVEGHHDDYSKPLDVIWLCLKHHIWLHRGLKEML